MHRHIHFKKWNLSQLNHYIRNFCNYWHKTFLFLLESFFMTKVNFALKKSRVKHFVILSVEYSFYFLFNQFALTSTKGFSFLCTFTFRKSSDYPFEIIYYQKQLPEVFYKKGVLKNFANSRGNKHLYQSLFLKLRENVKFGCTSRSNDFWRKSCYEKFSSSRPDIFCKKNGSLKFREIHRKTLF